MERDKSREIGGRNEVKRVDEIISNGSRLNIYDRSRGLYGLGSGCHAEPKVGESIGSKNNDRNKLVTLEGR